MIKLIIIITKATETNLIHDEAQYSFISSYQRFITLYIYPHMCSFFIHFATTSTTTANNKGDMYN